MKLLNVNKLNVYYGNVQVLRDISLEINSGEIVALIGSNGAGKTTLMMTISGLLKPKSGVIEFLGSRIDGLSPHHIVSLGISQASQEKNLFSEMTVNENLELGAYRSPKSENIEEKMDVIYDYFPVLRQRKHQKAGSLSGGEQRMLAFSRALMSNLRLLILDELSAGLAPIVVKSLAKTIRNLIEKKGLTTLMVEQNVYLALGLADRGYVLETGILVESGRASDLLKSELVKKAYLGS